MSVLKKAFEIHRSLWSRLVLRRWITSRDRRKRSALIFQQASWKGSRLKVKGSGRRSAARQLSRHIQSRLIIRMIGHFLYVLDMLDGILLVDHENRPAQNPQIFDQRPVMLPERAAAMVGDHLHMVHAIR